MKVGEGEDAHRATFFRSLAGIIGGGGFSGFRGEKFPLTGLDKTLIVLPPTLRHQLNVSSDAKQSSHSNTNEAFFTNPNNRSKPNDTKSRTM
jgi:hypothetical protein